MKLVLISVLLSFTLLASTAYLGNLYLQSSDKVVVLKSQKIEGTCMYLDIHEYGHSYPTANFYAQNDCQKSLKFTITYYYSSPETQYTTKTKCLNQNEKDQVILYYYETIVQVIEEEC